MDLESRIILPHTSPFKLTGEDPSNLKRLSQKSGGRLFFIDNSVMSMPIGLIDTVISNVQRNGIFIPSDIHKMKVAYGQRKALAKLSRQGKLVTTPRIFQEYERGLVYFRKLNSALALLCPNNSQLEKYRQNLSNFTQTLTENLSLNLAEPPEILLDDFKSTPYCVTSYRYFMDGDIFEKEVSDTDLELYMLAVSHDISNPYIRERIILSADKDHLVQGPVEGFEHLLSRLKICFGKQRENHFIQAFHSYSQGKD